MRAGLLLILALAALPPQALAAPDVEKGDAVFQDRCSMCHQEEGVGQGPNLKGVVGRKAGTLEGFAYTAAMKNSGLTWTPANLNIFLTGPSKMVAGTTMPMTVPDADDRGDLIAFLASRK
jgi:cytochrome c